MKSIIIFFAVNTPEENKNEIIYCVFYHTCFWCSWSTLQ